MKILIAEGDTVSRRALERLLASWHYEVASVSDGESAWRVLQSSDAPRLAVLDWAVPVMDGLEVCRRLRRQAREPYTYAILLAARDDKKEVIRGLEAGADDYLTKPFDPQELRARLRVGRRSLAILDSLLSARDALRYQAGVDPQTGLASRVATFDALCREMARSARRGSSLAVLLAEFDAVESVSATYGNLVGDSVLREVARRVKSATRASDVVGRSGKQQFMVVLPDCDVESSRKYARRFHRSVSAPFTNFVEARIELAASVGVAASDGARFREGDPSRQAGSFLHAADSALRRARLGGKSRTEIATPLEFLLALPEIYPRTSSRPSRNRN